jgi:hypothetical protein
VIKDRHAVGLRQAFPVLHDPLGARRLFAEQAQVGFQDGEQPERADRDFAHAVGRPHGALAVQVQAEGDAQSCHYSASG